MLRGNCGLLVFFCRVGMLVATGHAALPGLVTMCVCVAFTTQSPARINGVVLMSVRSSPMRPGQKANNNLPHAFATVAVTVAADGVIRAVDATSQQEIGSLLSPLSLSLGLTHTQLAVAKAACDVEAAVPLTITHEASDGERVGDGCC